MNILILALLLTISPISELRGGIPLAVASGINPWLAFLLLTTANILIMFPVFFFLDYLHGYFMQFGFYRNSFNGIIKRSRRKLERYIGTRWQFLVLMLLVMIPSPGTGCYTGSLLAWFFNLKRRHAYLTIALGVLFAGVIVTLVSLSFLNLFY